MVNDFQHSMLIILESRSHTSFVKVLNDYRRKCYSNLESGYRQLRDRHRKFVKAAFNLHGYNRGE
jgi:hypothetical protein